MRAIAVAVAKSPSLLRHVEWRDLERALREVFEAIGFTTRLTRPGKDGGHDLELSCTERGTRSTFLVEVKHWVDGSKRPGADIVCSFFNIVARAGEGTTGLILSSSGFTKGALSGRTEVERQLVRLGDGEKVVSLFQNYLESEDGMLLPTTFLPDVLLAGTL